MTHSGPGLGSSLRYRAAESFPPDAADGQVLLLTMHHIVSDGRSMRVLLGELSARYAAHHEGREAGLP